MVKQAILRSFNGLSADLLKIAAKRKQHEDEVVCDFLPSLRQSHNVLLVACASPSVQHFSHTLPAVKFCSKIHNTIVKRLERKQHKVNPF